MTHEAALAEQPGFTPGWLGLGELYVDQRRWAEVEPILARLEGNGSGPVAVSLPGTVLRARCYLGRKEFGLARGMLAEALERTPQAVMLWALLSHALLQEGQDWAAAERTLHKVLELEPGNTEAQNNLEVLGRQQAARVNP